MKNASPSFIAALNEGAFFKSEECTDNKWYPGPADDPHKMLCITDEKSAQHIGNCHDKSRFIPEFQLLCQVEHPHPGQENMQDKSMEMM